MAAGTAALHTNLESALISLFQRAVSRGVVSEGVPRFGGRRILTLSFRPPPAEGKAGVALRRSVCERALVDCVAANEVPHAGLLAARLVRREPAAAQAAETGRAGLRALLPDLAEAVAALWRDGLVLPQEGYGTQALAANPAPALRA